MRLAVFFLVLEENVAARAKHVIKNTTDES